MENGTFFSNIKYVVIVTESNFIFYSFALISFFTLFFNSEVSLHRQLYILLGCYNSILRVHIAITIFMLWMLGITSSCLIIWIWKEQTLNVAFFLAYISLDAVVYTILKTLVPKIEKVRAASLRVTRQSLGFIRERKTQVRVLRALLPTGVQLGWFGYIQENTFVTMMLAGLEQIVALLLSV